MNVTSTESSKAIVSTVEQDVKLLTFYFTIMVYDLSVNKSVSEGTVYSGTGCEL